MAKGTGEGKKDKQTPGGDAIQPAGKSSDKAGGTGGVPVFARRPIRNIQDAKKMLGRLIYGFQLGQIDGYNAKTLCYLIVSYCAITKDCELEDRIKKLEEHLSKGGK